jgi:hypothetical protein
MLDASAEIHGVTKKKKPDMKGASRISFGDPALE